MIAKGQESSGDLVVSNAEHAQWLEAVAQAISKRGLATPAILLLEMHRPIAGIVGTVALGASPILRSLSSLCDPEKLHWLCSSDLRMEQLIARLEVLRRNPSAVGESDSLAGSDEGCVEAKPLTVKAATNNACSINQKE